MIRPAALLLVLLACCNAGAQTLVLEDCRISAGTGMPSMKARCGTLLRPLDPAGEVAGEIELRIAVVPALNLTPEPDPVVPIAGGPGQGSVQFYTAYSAAFERLRRNRDILLVDQRGTGLSARMDCEFDDDVVEGQYSPELTVRYARECLDALPFDARFFTTSVAVKDLEAVRTALGYTQLNLYGVSYGTRVAQHFARRYPEATRTLTIDGVLPPQKSLGPEIATESQRAINRIFARCAAKTRIAMPHFRKSMRASTGYLRACARDRLTLPYPTRTQVDRSRLLSAPTSSRSPFDCWHTVRDRLPCCHCW